MHTTHPSVFRQGSESLPFKTINKALGMFRNNSPKQIFRFLDEQSHFLQELMIMRSFPTLLFVKQFFKRLFGANH